MGSQILGERIVKSAQCRWFLVARNCDTEKKNRELTISHGQSKRSVVKLDVVDFQHVHEELQRSQHIVRSSHLDPRRGQQRVSRPEFETVKVM